MMNLPNGIFVGRVWRSGIGPALVTLRDGRVIDITTRAVPTMRDLIELDDPVAHVAATKGQAVTDYTLLAPCDLQAVKASGVTFAASMVERVIEEQAAGDPDAAEAIRARIGNAIGASLRGIKPGSPRPQTSRRRCWPRVCGRSILRWASAPMPRSSPSVSPWPRSGMGLMWACTR